MGALLPYASLLEHLFPSKWACDNCTHQAANGDASWMVYCRKFRKTLKQYMLSKSSPLCRKELFKKWHEENTWLSFYMNAWLLYTKGFHTFPMYELPWMRKCFLLAILCLSIMDHIWKKSKNTGIHHIIWNSISLLLKIVDAMLHGSCAAAPTVIVISSLVHQHAKLGKNNW